MKSLTLKKKIIMLAVILLLLIAGCVISAAFGMHKLYLAKHEAITALHIQEKFQELRLSFEKSLMGPHDYLIHGRQNEKEIFRNTISKLKEEYEHLNHLLAKEKSDGVTKFQQMLEKAESGLLSMREVIAEYEKNTNKIFLLNDPVGDPLSGSSMENIDILVTKIQDDLEKQGILFSVLSQEKMEQARTVRIHVQNILIILGISALLAGTILSFLIIRSITGPVGKLIAATQKITDGDFDARAEVESNDEIGNLAKHFNDMVKELVIAKERISSIFQGSGDGMRVIDKKFNILQSNDEMVRLTGVSTEELAGKKCYELFRHESCLTEMCTLNRVMKGEKRIETEIIKQTKTGKRIPVSLVATPLIEEGKIVGVIESFRDISEQKKVEEDLIKAKVAAERANHAKSEFLANMSHEIRTPMNGIVGMTELLFDTELTEEQLEYAQTVRKSANELLNVINDILDYSKIEVGKMELENIDFDLRITVEDTTEVLVMQAYKKKLEMACLIHHDVPSLLRGDPGSLRQILINLIGNAIKFTEKGEVVIRVILEKEDDTHATIRFNISDTGIGIPQDRIDFLFQSFTQADSSITRKYGGTGLGLAISKKLVEMMGGKIGVESEEGKGSTFWFTAVFEKQIEKHETEIATPDDIRGKRILIVDDNATNRYVLKEQLSLWNCILDEASSGKIALEKLHKAVAENNPFDIAIIDMQMPIMDGASLGKKIKEDPDLNKTIMIMLTSAAQRGDAARLKATGFAAYLIKPVKLTRLYDCLATVIGRQTKADDTRQAELVTKHSLAEDRKHKILILIVEDNETNQNIVMHILKKSGYRADAVSNGEEAINALVKTHYDIVLMDIQMPIMDGFEATKIVRDPESKVLNHSIPIIAMTAHAMKEDRERCLEAKMDDYISKPINSKELLEKIKKWSSKEKEPQKTKIYSK